DRGSGAAQCGPAFESPMAASATRKRREHDRDPHHIALRARLLHRRGFPPVASGWIFSAPSWYHAPLDSPRRVLLLRRVERSHTPTTRRCWLRYEQSHCLDHLEHRRLLDLGVQGESNEAEGR